MKSTGEAMGIGRTFQAALMKAVRGLDLKRETPDGQRACRVERRRTRSRRSRNRITSGSSPLPKCCAGRCDTAQGDNAIERIVELSAIDQFWLYEIAEIVEAEERSHPSTGSG